MLTVSCLIIGALPYLEVREFRDTRMIPLENVRSVETETMGRARIRFEGGGSFLSRISAERVRRAMRNCDEREALRAELPPPYEPPVAPRASIRDAW
jgi:hypothetical protein